MGTARAQHLNRALPISIYHLLKSIILDRIRHAEPKSDGRLPSEDSVDQSLYDLLDWRYDPDPARAEELQLAVLLSAEDFALLQMPQGAAGLGAERVTYLASGQPLELVHSLM